jgi:sortase (surface protein transpeptidase)
MKGDFSRDTFDSKKHYSRVLMQQGRVQLDADWNEQQLITQQRAEITARDVIGLIGAPRIEAGFRVTTTGANLSISAGHFYVDG